MESNNRIPKSEALALASTNLEELLGVKPAASLSGDLVATLGGSILDFEAKVVGIISPRRHCGMAVNTHPDEVEVVIYNN